jgi:hypothetical protein
MKLYAEQKWHVTYVFALLCFATTTVDAQRAMAPGPEVKQLQYFVGQWSSSGKMSLGTTSGDFSATDRQDWLDGGFFIENSSAFETPFGKGTLIELLGYDARRKVYIHESFSSTGQHTSSTGAFDGDTWVWTSLDGQSRHVIKILSPTSFSFKTELSSDGKSWTTLVDGKSTKRQ